MSWSSLLDTCLSWCGASWCSDTTTSIADFAVFWNVYKFRFFWIWFKLLNYHTLSIKQHWCKSVNKEEKIEIIDFYAVNLQF